MVVLDKGCNIVLPRILSPQTDMLNTQYVQSSSRTIAPFEVFKNIQNKDVSDV